MILFKKVHIPMILGETEYLKTKTRRLGQKRWNIGSIHNLQTDYRPESIFCYGKIVNVTRERLFDMNDKDANDEGYPNVEEFKKIWKSINGEWKDIKVWVIEFQTIKNKNPLSLKNFFK